MKGQTVSEVFISMPDSMAPYLNESIRTDMIKQYNGEHADTVVNLWEEPIRIGLLTDDYMSVPLSKALLLQLKLLPLSGGDTVICLLKTFSGPSAESSIEYYNLSWQPVHLKGYLDGFTVEDLFFKPDGMTDSDYQEARKLFDPLMVKMYLGAETEQLLIGLSHPLLSKEEQDKAESIIKTVRLDWKWE